MMRKDISRSLFALGLMLLGYTLATESAITGSVALNYSDPRLKFNWFLLGISASLILVSLLLMLAQFMQKVYERKVTSDGLDELNSLKGLLSEPEQGQRDMFNAEQKA